MRGRQKETTGIQVRGKAIALAAAMLLSLATALVAQGMPDPGASFLYEDARHDAGTLYHYRISLDTKKPAIDYWLYMDDDSVVQTLHDGSRIDGLGLARTAWRLDYGAMRFHEARTEYLLPHGEKGLRARSRRWDWDAAKLSSAWEFGGGKKGQASWEPIPWAPMAWQADLGLSFSLFLRHMKPDAGSIPLCYDAFGHPILMTLRKVGEEDVNGIPCIKYTLWGDGLWSHIVGQGGSVWMARDESERFMVKHTMRIGLSWKMPKMAMELAERRKIEPEEWIDLLAELARTEGGAADID